MTQDFSQIPIAVNSTLRHSFRMLGGGILLGLLTTSLVACGSNSSGGAQSSNRGPHSELIPTSEVCYPQTCIPTSIVNEDPGPDYVYPNPDNYPNSDLRHQYIAPKRFIDLSLFAADQFLSPNFLLKELMSFSKGRYGIFSPKVLGHLENIRTVINQPLYVTSAYRSPGYNRRTDGAATFSRHMYGDAVDLVAENLTPSQMKQKCLDEGASFYQIYSGHIHCDWRLEPLDPTFYDIETPIQPHVTLVDPYSALKRHSTLEWRAEDQEFVVEAALPMLEDDGLPIYEWIVELPDGTAVTLDTPEARLPLQSGIYKISVTIGGSVTLERNIVW